VYCDNYMKKMDTSQKLFLISALYFGVISIVSQVPGQSIRLLEIEIWDKGIHFVEYLILGLLLGGGFALRPLKTRRHSALWIGVGLSIVAVAGSLDEIHQMFVPGRQCSLADVFADVVGGTSGFVCSFFAVTAKKKS
jgi:VanZ family protein